MEFIKTTLLKYDNEVGSTFSLGFLDESIGNLYKKERNMSLIMSVFALLAVLLSMIGTIGVISLEMQFRKREICIRKIIGATAYDILKMNNKGYVIYSLISFIISCPIAYFIIEKWQDQFVYKTIIPFWIYIVAFISVLAVSVIIIILQTYSTAQKNPLKFIYK